MRAFRALRLAAFSLLAACADGSDPAGVQRAGLQGTPKVGAAFQADPTAEASDSQAPWRSPVRARVEEGGAAAVAVWAEERSGRHGVFAARLEVSQGEVTAPASPVLLGESAYPTEAQPRIAGPAAQGEEEYLAAWLGTDGRIRARMLGLDAKPRAPSSFAVTTGGVDSFDLAFHGGAYEFVWSSGADLYLARYQGGSVGQAVKLFTDPEGTGCSLREVAMAQTATALMVGWVRAAAGGATTVQAMAFAPSGSKALVSYVISGAPSTTGPITLALAASEAVGVLVFSPVPADASAANRAYLVRLGEEVAASAELLPQGSAGTRQYTPWVGHEDGFVLAWSEVDQAGAGTLQAAELMPAGTPLQATKVADLLYSDPFPSLALRGERTILLFNDRAPSQRSRAPQALARTLATGFLEGELAVLSRGANAQTRPAAAAHAASRTQLLVWEDARQGSSLRGLLLTGGETGNPVAPPNPTGVCAIHHPRIAAGNEGYLVVHGVERCDGTLTLEAAAFDPATGALMHRLVLEDGHNGSGSFDVAFQPGADGGRFQVAWVQETAFNHIQLRARAVSWKPSSAPQLEGEVPLLVASLESPDTTPRVACGWECAVVWHPGQRDPNGNRPREIGAALLERSGEVSVETLSMRDGLPVSEDARPAIAAADDGFALAWSQPLGMGAQGVVASRWKPGTAFEPGNSIASGSLQYWRRARPTLVPVEGGFLAAWVEEPTAFDPVEHAELPAFSGRLMVAYLGDDLASGGSSGQVAGVFADAEAQPALAETGGIRGVLAAAGFDAEKGVHRVRAVRLGEEVGPPADAGTADAGGIPGPGETADAGTAELAAPGDLFGCSAAGTGPVLLGAALAALALRYRRARVGLLLAGALAASDARAAAPRRAKVAVLSLQASQGVEPGAAEILTEQLATAIQGQLGAPVLATRDIQNMIGFDRQRTLMGCTEDSCLQDLGGALGVDDLVSGSVGRLGDLMVFHVQRLSLRRVGAVRRFSARMSAKDQESWLNAMDQAALALFGPEGTAGEGQAKAPGAGTPAATPPARTAPEIPLPTASAEQSVALALRFQARPANHLSGAFALVASWLPTRSLELGAGAMATGFLDREGSFGVLGRLALMPQVTGSIRLGGALELPVLLTPDRAVGAGLAPGVEWQPKPWLSLGVHAPVYWFFAAPEGATRLYFFLAPSVALKL